MFSSSVKFFSVFLKMISVSSSILLSFMNSGSSIPIKFISSFYINHTKNPRKAVPYIIYDKSGLSEFVFTAIARSVARLTLPFASAIILLPF